MQCFVKNVFLNLIKIESHMKSVTITEIDRHIAECAKGVKKFSPPYHRTHTQEMIIFFKDSLKQAELELAEWESLRRLFVEYMFVAYKRRRNSGRGGHYGVCRYTTALKMSVDILFIGTGGECMRHLDNLNVNWENDSWP
jgi:hypothetical protein